mmetsp:Transcript_4167/g.15580  ORF Transcript_4167/g.15580 Transcript_4167/m.15580 type:complete len:210 (-) Transcript_4167:619-1248(-)
MPARNASTAASEVSLLPGSPKNIATSASWRQHCTNSGLSRRALRSVSQRLKMPRNILSSAGSSLAMRMGQPSIMKGKYEPVLDKSQPSPRSRPTTAPPQAVAHEGWKSIKLRVDRCRMPRLFAFHVELSTIHSVSNIWSTISSFSAEASGKIRMSVPLPLPTFVFSARKASNFALSAMASRTLDFRYITGSNLSVGCSHITSRVSTCAK